MAVRCLARLPMLRRLPSELPLLRRPRGPMATTVVSRTSRVSSEHTHDPRQNMYQPYRVYSTAYRILSETVRVLTSRHYSLGVVLLGYSAQSQSRRTASGAARRERRGPDGTGDPQTEPPLPQHCGHCAFVAFISSVSASLKYMLIVILYTSPPRRQRRCTSTLT